MARMDGAGMCVVGTSCIVSIVARAGVDRPTHLALCCLRRRQRRSHNGDGEENIADSSEGTLYRRTAARGVPRLNAVDS